MAGARFCGPCGPRLVYSIDHRVLRSGRSPFRSPIRHRPPAYDGAADGGCANFMGRWRAGRVIPSRFTASAAPVFKRRLVAISAPHQKRAIARPPSMEWPMAGARFRVPCGQRRVYDVDRPVKKWPVAISDTGRASAIGPLLLGRSMAGARFRGPAAPPVVLRHRPPRFTKRPIASSAIR